VSGERKPSDDFPYQEKNPCGTVFRKQGLYIQKGIKKQIKKLFDIIDEGKLT